MERVSDEVFSEWKTLVALCSRCGVENDGKGFVGMWKDGGVKVVNSWNHQKHWDSYFVLCKVCAAEDRALAKLTGKTPTQVEYTRNANELERKLNEADVVWAIRLIDTVDKAVTKVMPGKTFEGIRSIVSNMGVVFK